MVSSVKVFVVSSPEGFDEALHALEQNTPEVSGVRVVGLDVEFHYVDRRPCPTWVILSGPGVVVLVFVYGTVVPRALKTLVRSDRWIKAGSNIIGDLIILAKLFNLEHINTATLDIRSCFEMCSSDSRSLSRAIRFTTGINEKESKGERVFTSITQDDIHYMVVDGYYSYHIGMYCWVGDVVEPLASYDVHVHPTTFFNCVSFCDFVWTRPSDEYVAVESDEEFPSLKEVGEIIGGEEDLGQKSLRSVSGDSSSSGSSTLYYAVPHPVQQGEHVIISGASVSTAAKDAVSSTPVETYPYAPISDMKTVPQLSLLLGFCGLETHVHDIEHWSCATLDKSFPRSRSRDEKGLLLFLPAEFDVVRMYIVNTILRATTRAIHYSYSGFYDSDTDSCASGVSRDCGISVASPCSSPVTTTPCVEVVREDDVSLASPAPSCATATPGVDDFSMGEGHSWSHDGTRSHGVDGLLSPFSWRGRVCAKCAAMVVHRRTSRTKAEEFLLGEYCCPNAPSQTWVPNYKVCESAKWYIPDKVLSSWGFSA